MERSPADSDDGATAAAAFSLVTGDPLTAPNAASD